MKYSSFRSIPSTSVLVGLALLTSVATSACRRSAPAAQNTTQAPAVPASDGGDAAPPILNAAMVERPPPPGGTPVVRADGGRPENCPILVNERCYTTPREACQAAGCTTACSILETYPGQVSCR